MPIYGYLNSLNLRAIVDDMATDLNSKIIVLTGGTGFVGRELISQLAAKGYRVRVLTRDPVAARASMMGYTADFYRWNPLSERAPAEALEGAYGVVHLAGESVASGRWTAHRRACIRDSRVLGTRHLVEGMKALKKRPEAFVSTSAVGFYGDRDDETLTETSSAGDGFLADVCKEWESEARAFGEGLTILRAGLVLGRKGGMLARVLPVFRAGLGGTLGDGQQWMSWIHLHDLAALYVFALEHPGGVRVWNGVAPKPVLNAEFTRVLAQTLRRPALLPAPAFALKWALGEMSTAILGSQRVLPAGPLKEKFPFRFNSLEMAMADILARPRIAGTAKKVALPG